MSKHSISVAITFCSLDLRFISYCIDAAKTISDNIIVPICDHFYDGSKEDLESLNQLYLAYPDVEFIQFSYNKRYIYGLDLEKHPDDLDWKRLWIASSRYLGFFFTKPNDYILFLDSDEIIDTELFQVWLDSMIYKKYDIITLSAYHYFREPIYQSIGFQRLTQLAKKSKLSKELILNPDERLGVFKNLSGMKSDDTLSLCKKPMIHHYSWAKTKSELLKKCRCWGHYFEKDWEKLIETEFSGPFSGKDFWSKSKYRTLDKPVHDVMKAPTFEKKATNLNHVKHIDRQSFFKLELQKEFNL